MLDLFRRRKGGLKWTLWLVILALGGSMVLFFGTDRGGVGGGLGNRDVAVVVGNPITAVQFRRHYGQLLEYYRRIYRLDDQNPAFLKQLGLGQQALNQLISTRVIRHEAQALGVDVTAGELAEYITTIPSFRENGSFIGAERYRQTLRANGISTAEFEDERSNEIVRDKLMRVLTDGIRATDSEVHEEFVNRNEEVKIRYVVADPQQLAPANVEEEALQAYFEENKDGYTTPERRRVMYVQIDTDTEAVQLSEEEIERHMASITEKQAVRASHILIAIDEESQAQEARKLAQDLLNQAQGGADFGALAKTHSTDQATAAGGGDLGFFKRGEMVPEFERVAFSLDPGELSDLVLTPFGYHIIKVTEVDEVDPRPLAESQLRQQEAARMARNLATKIAHEGTRQSDLETAAARYDREVRETDFFAVGEPITGLEVGRDFNQQVFTLAQGQMSETYEADGTFIVARLEEIEPSGPADFESVRERVLADHKSTRGEELGREKAFAFFQATQEGTDFQRAARTQRLAITSSDPLKRGASIEDLGSSLEILNRARQMEVGETSPPVIVGGKYVVFELLERSAIDEEKYREESAAIREQLTQQKRTRFFSAWVENATERLRENEQIYENPELLDVIVS